jgi:hypothetical protein
MQKIKKIFFYIIWTSISFLGVFKSEAILARPMYWVEDRPKPMYWIEPSLMILDLIKWILWFIWLIISPIIFLIWLYFFLTKKVDKKRKERGIKYMKRAVILAVIVFLLWLLVDWIFSFYNNY